MFCPHFIYVFLFVSEQTANFAYITSTVWFL